MAGVRTEVDVAWGRFENSSVFSKWKADNPGEYDKLDSYRMSAWDGPEPQGIETEFGLGLLAMVNAGKMGDGSYQGI